MIWVWLPLTVVPLALVGAYLYLRSLDDGWCMDQWYEDLESGARKGVSHARLRR